MYFLFLQTNSIGGLGGMPSLNLGGRVGMPTAGGVPVAMDTGAPAMGIPSSASSGMPPTSTAARPDFAGDCRHQNSALYCPKTANVDYWFECPR